MPLCLKSVTEKTNWSFRSSSQLSMVSPGAAILWQRDESLRHSRQGDRCEDCYRQRKRSPTAWKLAGAYDTHSTSPMTRRTVPSKSQRVHKKFVTFAQGDRMRVCSEFHAYVVSAEKITNRHDPTCFDVVDVGTRLRLVPQ
jgi:hypothetical protein